MAGYVVSLCAGFLMVAIVTGQSIKQEWTPEEFPNPMLDAISCGFPNNYPSYICDPNGIIGSDVNEINWILKDVAYNSTNCPCSTYHCETQGAPKGYRIGVALVRRMKPVRSVDGKIMSLQDQAQRFTHVLRNTGWKLGKCEEEIIIFYSVDDKMLAIYTGRTAGLKLTPHYRDLLAYKIGGRLEDGKVVEALNVLLHDIKIVLNCASGECSLYDSQGGSNSSPNLNSFRYTAAFFFAFLSIVWGR